LLRVVYFHLLTGRACGEGRKGARCRLNGDGSGLDSNDTFCGIRI
jgi:hypothetical protein